MFTKIDPSGRMHRIEEPFIKQLGDVAKNCANVLFHSGRTDRQFGHRDLQNRSRLGEYHFHHTRGPHLPCCNGQSPGQNAYIINPYTGRAIALGRPYVFQNREFFSINLVARALTVWDTRGASLSLLPVFPPPVGFSAGGSFSACKLGESSSADSGVLGERFSFVYPTWSLIGSIRNNTFFPADGDRDGRLQLLSHTTRAELDPDRCYAYINLETLRDYMVSGNFFTSFTPGNEGVWRFTHTNPLREITAPREGESFKVGDTLTVRAAIQDVREANLIINGQTVERRTGLSGRNVVFIGHQLTDNNIGNTTIGVTARNGHDADVHVPSVRINVSEAPIRCTMMENIARDTTLEVQDVARRISMVTMGQALLNEGHEPAFVAGMLANIMREGSFGQFENSNYATNPAAMPQYLRYFVDNHNYTERFSNRYIYDLDITPNELYEITSNSPNTENIFGLGVVQWTHVSRFFPLLQLYIEATGGGARRITRAEVIESEMLMMIRELREGGSHNFIYRDWHLANSNVNSEDAAFNAAHILCLRYLIPRDVQTKAIQRGNDARAIFRIMIS